MRAAPRTAAKAGKTPAGTATALPALEELVAEPLLLAEPVLLLPDFAVLPPVPVEVGTVLVGETPEDGPVAPTVEPVSVEPVPVELDGDEPPDVRQVSSVPAATVKGAEGSVRPVLSLIVKISEVPSVALTVHVCSVPVKPLKVAIGVPPEGPTVTMYGAVPPVQVIWKGSHSLALLAPVGVLMVRVWATAPAMRAAAKRIDFIVSCGWEC